MCLVVIESRKLVHVTLKKCVARMIEHATAQEAQKAKSREKCKVNEGVVEDNATDAVDESGHDDYLEPAWVSEWRERKSSFARRADPQKLKQRAAVYEEKVSERRSKGGGKKERGGERKRESGVKVGRGMERKRERERGARTLPTLWAQHLSPSTLLHLRRYDAYAREDVRCSHRTGSGTLTRGLCSSEI